MMSDEDEIETVEPGEPHPADVIAALHAENVELKDKLLRALAETENTRRRAERDRADASTYAVTRFAREMLTIADNFARALAHLPPAVREAADPHVQAVLEGVEATERPIPISIRPLRRSLAKAGRPARSSTSCRPATRSATVYCAQPW